MIAANRESYLGVIILALSGVQEHSLKMMDLPGAVRVDTGHSDQIDQHEKTAVRQEFSDHRPHSQISETLLAQKHDFTGLQSNGSLAWSSSERRDALGSKAHIDLINKHHATVFILTFAECRYSSSSASRFSCRYSAACLSLFEFRMTKAKKITMQRIYVARISKDKPKNLTLL